MGVLDDVAAATGTALGTAATGAASPITAIAGLVAKALNFIPDPQAKLTFQSHALDVQAQLQMAQLDAEAKEIQANAGAQNDHYLGRVRGGFCWVVIALLLWNDALVYLVNALFHAHIEHADIPLSVWGMFGTIMLGFIGVPAGIEAVKQIIAMPGESQVKVLGMSVSNKS